MSPPFRGKDAAAVTRQRFKRGSGAHLLIGANALSVILEHRQTSSDRKESGGMLIGRFIQNSEDVVVDLASAPASQDLATRFTFWRSCAPAQKIVNDLWEESHSTANYLGEWHTHPEDDPKPSHIDVLNWKRILKKITA